MYNIRPTTKFQKDLKRVKKRGFDISLLTDIIKKLAASTRRRRHRPGRCWQRRKWEIRS